MTLRIVFMGTPEFSVPTLLALHKAGHDIVACYCQPPRPAGRRGLEHLPSPVQIAAERLSVPVCSPTSLKDEAEQKKFAAWNADLAIVVAYGLLLPQKVLNAPRLGCFNGHASLLPRWRGAAPIQRAIMAGDNETGTMVMKMEIGLDTGPVALSATVPIEETTTAGELHDALSVLTANLMVEAMTALENGTLSLTPQPDEGVIYAEKISKAETRINWNQPADHVRRHINGLSPFPGSWCEMELGGKLQRVKILQAARCDNEDGRAAKAGDLIGDNLTIACSNGAVRLLRLQKAGSKPMDVDEFMRGNTITNRHLLS